MVYPYTGVLFNPKMELGMDTCYNVDEPQGHCLQRNSEPDTKAHILNESTDMDHRGKSVEMESVLVVAREWKWWIVVGRGFEVWL